MKNDNHNCLPFYERIDEQNHRRNYAYGDIYPLFCPNDRFLAFQIARRHTTTAVQIQLINLANESDARDITAEVTRTLQSWTIVENAYTDNAGNAMDIIVYAPNFSVFRRTLEEGRYYLRFYDGNRWLYSEVFTVVSRLSNYLRITWRNLTDIRLADGWIKYEGLGFTYNNTLYLATELGKPEYPFDEEGENRDGYFFAEKQVSSKTYKAVTIAPEYLCDCMRLIRLSDIVDVRDGYGNEYACDTFLATPTWQEQGNLAEVILEFTTGTVVKTIGHGWTRSGDFNSADFNSDYNNFNT